MVILQAETKQDQATEGLGDSQMCIFSPSEITKTTEIVVKRHYQTCSFK